MLWQLIQSSSKSYTEGWEKQKCYQNNINAGDPILKGIIFNEIHLVYTVLFIQSRIFLNMPHIPVCHTQIHRCLQGP